MSLQFFLLLFVEAFYLLIAVRMLMFYKNDKNTSRITYQPHFDNE